MRRLATAFGFATLVLALAGCGSPGPRPGPADYVVRRGDTLYSISWRHGLDYRELARWNGIGSDYAIRVGERLSLAPPSRAVRAPERPPAAATTPPPRFAWPADAPALERVTQPQGGVGIAILGRPGDPVRAAAAGRVVYVGSGLRAYGQLVIVKHDDTWLTAYGCNREVYVAEGARVAAGERIAAMGVGAANRPQLYFEVRASGRPVDPATVLPPR